MQVNRIKHEINFFAAILEHDNLAYIMLNIIFNKLFF
jgi:hypothetical protein